MLGEACEVASAEGPKAGKTYARDGEPLGLDNAQW